MSNAIAKDQPAFTPGPWVTDECYPENIYCNDATGSIVASVGAFAFAPRTEVERLANARLIAAAPEMFEALKEAVALHLMDAKIFAPTSRGAAWMKSAKAALSKASGEQP